jgi:hypothetical protein
VPSSHAGCLIAQALDTVWLRDSEFVAGDISIAGERLTLLTAPPRVSSLIHLASAFSRSVAHQLSRCHCRTVDLLICCELEQLVMLAAAPPEVPRQEALLTPFGRVLAWQGRVKAATAPHYNEVSQFLHTVAARMAADAPQTSRL